MRMIALSLLLAGSVEAAVIAEAVQGKLRIELHDEAGVCVGSARMAIFSDGEQKIPGCWVVQPDAVQIAFLDGDVARLPLAVFKKPESI